MTTLEEPLPPPPPELDDVEGVAPARRSWWHTGLHGRAKLAVGALVGFGGAGYLMAMDPSTSAAYPPCPLKALTGVDCAGCGGLRCTHALLTGDLERAADHNILMVVALPFLAYLAVRWALGRRGVQLPAPRWTQSMTWVLAVVLVVFSVVRNLPWGPLPYLFSDAAGV